MTYNLREKRFPWPPAVSPGPFCITEGFLFQQSPAWDEEGQPSAVGGLWRGSSRPGSQPNPSSLTCMVCGQGPCLHASSLENSPRRGICAQQLWAPCQVPRAGPACAFLPANRMMPTLWASILISGSFRTFMVPGCAVVGETNPRRRWKCRPALFHLFLSPRVRGQPLPSDVKNSLHSSGKEVLGCKVTAVSL